MSLNKVILSGNIGADAELRYTKGGGAVASFSLAVNERVPQGEGEWGEYTNWVDCVMFGKRAEALAPWLRKGGKVALVGHIRTGSYEKDGRRVKRWDVRVDDVELMQRAPERKAAQASADAPAPPVEPAEALLYDDIPF